jgi:hypothetical protein
VGGEVRGNYAILNALNKGSNVTLSNGNLESSHAGSSVHSRAVGTVGVSSSKWYFEATLTALGGQWPAVGVAFSKSTDMATYVGAETGTVGYYGGGGVNGGGGGRTYSTYTTGDVIGVAIDLDNSRVTFYKNGANAVTSGTTYESITAGEVYVPAVSGYGSSAAWACNFGQRAFAYTAPSGFKALCTQNLPAPLVTKPSDVMDVVLYTGNNSTQSITSLAFNPDMVWSKCRNVGRSHRLSDAIRGSNVDLYTDTTASDNFYGSGSITAFTANGFNLDNSASSQYNTSGETYVSWCWDAGTSTATNNSGSISSQVRANPTAGFSVVTYTGNAISTATVGHGLGVSPSLIITKSRSNSSNWGVYHSSIGPTQYLLLNSTSAAQTSSSPWNNTAPTSTVFSIGDASFTNVSGYTYVGYAFAPVVGYSAMGSYTGDGSTSGFGPFIFCGFRPKFVLIKGSSVSYSWLMLDSVRNPSNLTTQVLYSDSSTSEMTNNGIGSGGYESIDILSNGFQIKSNSARYNQSGATYIYYAVAEAPFNYSRAR